MTDKEAWDMYYASIAGWVFHPGNSLEIESHLDLAASMATRMLEHRRETWPDGEQQQLQEQT